MFNQLIQPNLSVVGQSDLCLAYVTTIFNVPEKYNTATDAWNAAQYKHVGDPPTNVSVPVWFSWTGTINGITANYGHVACSVNGTKFYSVSAIGDQIFNSIQELMNFIGGGIEYLGWSEDINNDRVVEENNMEQPPNSGDVINAKRFSTGVPTYQSPPAEVASYQTATGWHDLLYDTISGGTVQVELASQKGVDKSSVISYINSNLN